MAQPLDPERLRDEIREQLEEVEEISAAPSLSPLRPYGEKD